MIGGIFPFRGAALKALPPNFSFAMGQNHARSRSMAAKVRVKTDQAEIAARIHGQVSDILERMLERRL